MANVCNAAFKQQVVLACIDALERAGFVRFRKAKVDLPIGGGFRCWIGLNTGLYPQYVEINPFVGVHAVEIEKLWISLKTGKKTRKYDRGVATYAIHMGEIAPREKVFHFTPEANIPVEATRLASLYAGAGLAYAKSIASYEALLPLFQASVHRLGVFPERYACCLYLMGRVAEARTFVQEFTASSQQNANYLENFGSNFLKLMNN